MNGVHKHLDDSRGVLHFMKIGACELRIPTSEDFIPRIDNFFAKLFLYIWLFREFMKTPGEGISCGFLASAEERPERLEKESTQAYQHTSL